MYWRLRQAISSVRLRVLLQRLFARSLPCLFGYSFPRLLGSGRVATGCRNLFQIIFSVHLLLFRHNERHEDVNDVQLRTFCRAMANLLARATRPLAFSASVG